MLRRSCHSLLVAAVVVAADSDTAVRDRAVAASVEADPSVDASMCLLQREHREHSHRHQTAEGMGDAPMASAARAVAAAMQLQATTLADAAAVAGGSVQHSAAGAAASASEGKSTHEAQSANNLASKTAEKATAVTAAVARDTAHRAAAEAKGVSEGLGLDYTANTMVQLTMDRYGEGETKPVFHQRNKITLLVIDACPLCWMLGIDRFYLGSIGLGITKLIVCIATLGVGGVIWGLIDFIAVLVNAFKKEQTLSAVGMHATFEPKQLDPAFVLALVDILAIPVFIGLIKFYRDWQKRLRMQKLAEAAIKSPDYGKNPSAVAKASGA